MASAAGAGAPIARALLALLACGSLAGLGCASDSSAAQAAGRAGRHANPFSSFDITVTSVVPRGTFYLEARLLSDFDLTMVFPATEECAALLVPEATMRWTRTGNFGTARNEDQRCDAIGTTSLAAWRDRRSRRVRGGAFPRDTARWREVYRDEEVVLLRGRFRLAGLVSIPGGVDIVAFVPNTVACQGVIESGQAALEFRDAGDQPFRLGGREDACPVIGFAQPPRDMPR